MIALAIKTGFLYVLDRRDGRFLKGVKFSDTPVPPFWATGLDPETGRPIESVHARPRKGMEDSVVVSPSATGTANWFSTAFHPPNQLMVIVANETTNHRFWTPDEYVPGEFFISGNLEEFEDKEFEGMFRRVGEWPGRVCAYDLRTMTKKWEAQREPEIRWGGPADDGRRPRLHRHAERHTAGDRHRRRQDAVGVSDRFGHYGPSCDLRREDDATRDRAQRVTFP